MNRNFFINQIIFIILVSGISPLRSQTLRVSGIDIRGNHKLSDGKIKSAIETRANSWHSRLTPWTKAPLYDEEVFLNDLLRIEKLYYQEGYLEAKVTNYEVHKNKNNDEVKLVIFVKEGSATTVRNVTFIYTDSSKYHIPVRKLGKKVVLKSGKRYREEDLRKDYNSLMQEFGDHGFPYVQVRVKPVIHKKNHYVDLEWILQTGPYSYFGDISFAGNRHVSSKAIRRGLGFRTGEPFSRKKLVSAQRQVYRLELFRFVSMKTTALDSTPVNIPINVRVKESSLRTLKFGLGYGSEEAFRVSAQWRHRNFLGGARILRAQIKHSTRLLPVSVELQLSQPYFLGNKNDLLLKPFFVKQDEKSFKARRIGMEMTVNRQLNPKANLFLTTIFERDTIETKADVKDITTELEDLYNKSIIRVGFRRNGTDQLLTPTSGGITTVIIENSGQFLRAPRKYRKISLDQRIFRRMGKGVVFAGRVMLGSMGSTGKSATPIEERFFSGGSISIRGWARQRLGPVVSVVDSSGNRVFTPIGGNSVLETNLELRYPLFKNFSAASFLDFGNVWRDFNGFDLTDLHYSLGSGIRYNTVVGPMRIDFAWKLNEQPQDTQRWQVHFSIGHAF